ncbi:MAG: GatB/YqeY domain-containing protein [Candidatus Margulisbacteria bacterium]|nr:GatB/YqeY domain-containing protein [Candidatus Margulisiibacteriota bacterium]
MTLFEQINNDIKEAMKAKDELKLSVLRMMKSKVLYVNARGDLPEAEVMKIVNKYGKDLKETIEEYRKINRAAEVAQAEKELAIVQTYLPKELTPDELKVLVEQAIAESGAASAKEMGKVMKVMQAKAPGADGKLVSQLVRDLLK